MFERGGTTKWWEIFNTDQYCWAYVTCKKGAIIYTVVSLSLISSTWRKNIHLDWNIGCLAYFGQLPMAEYIGISDTKYSRFTNSTAMCAQNMFFSRNSKNPRAEESGVNVSYNIRWKIWYGIFILRECKASFLDEKYSNSSRYDSIGLWIQDRRYQASQCMQARSLYHIYASSRCKLCHRAQPVNSKKPGVEARRYIQPPRKLVKRSFVGWLKYTDDLRNC